MLTLFWGRNDDTNWNFQPTPLRANWKMSKHRGLSGVPPGDESSSSWWEVAQHQRPAVQHDLHILLKQRQPRRLRLEFKANYRSQIWYYRTGSSPDATVLISCPLVARHTGDWTMTLQHRALMWPDIYTEGYKMLG